MLGKNPQGLKGQYSHRIAVNEDETEAMLCSEKYMQLWIHRQNGLSSTMLQK
jgi:hypothetical protein